MIQFGPLGHRIPYLSSNSQSINSKRQKISLRLIEWELYFHVWFVWQSDVWIHDGGQVDT